MIFNSKIYLACGTDELRPVMTYVCFRNGFAYATDAHVLAKQSLKKCFDCTDEEIAMLEGMMIDRESYKFLLGRPLRVDTKEGTRNRRSDDTPEKYKRVFLTTLFGKQNSKFTVELVDEYIAGRFPNAESVISKNPADVFGKEVWFDPRVLKRAFDCMYVEASFDRVNIRTTHSERGAQITNSCTTIEEQVVIAMPVKQPSL